MAPDLNSLSSLTQNSPASLVAATPQTMSSAANEHTNTIASTGEGAPSPSSRSRSASISLQAAATLNAGLQRGDSVPRSSNNSIPRLHSPSPGRRRSQVLMGLQMADPNIPAPGEMIPEIPNTGSNLSAALSAAGHHPISSSPQPLHSGEPRHLRAPSLGEIHQELENEQEFQVNRLLTEIRRLQQQIQRQQSSAISDDTTSDRSAPLPMPTSAPQSAHPTAVSGSVPRSPNFPRSSFDIARDLQRRSRTPSQGASPRLRSTSISAESGDQWVLGGRDESAFYQAETQMLIRENQMLRHRIRDLERQLEAGNGGNTSITHEPSHASHLNRSTSAGEEDTSQPAAEQPETAADASKQD